MTEEITLKHMLEHLDTMQDDEEINIDCEKL